MAVIAASNSRLFSEHISVNWIIMLLNKEYLSEVFPAFKHESILI